MIGKIISIVLGLLSLGRAPGSTEPSAVGKLGSLAAVGGAVLWLFGPGREMHYDLNLLELCAVVLAGVLGGEVLYRTPPPG